MTTLEPWAYCQLGHPRASRLVLGLQRDPLSRELSGFGRYLRSRLSASQRGEPTTLAGNAFGVSQDEGGRSSDGLNRSPKLVTAIEVGARGPVQRRRSGAAIRAPQPAQRGTLQLSGTPLCARLCRHPGRSAVDVAIARVFQPRQGFWAYAPSTERGGSVQIGLATKRAG
jgi:hypothetical protein